ncbi:unnamed protein product, partial [Ectocarpus sp. 13 AM-2016]
MKADSNPHENGAMDMHRRESCATATTHGKDHAIHGGFGVRVSINDATPIAIGQPALWKTFKPDTHAVDVTVALGQHGLGLVLGK